MDIFLHTSTEQEAEETLRKIFKAVQKNQARNATKQKLLVTRSKNAVTFPWARGPWPIDFMAAC